ncbi:unnamed protein product [Rhizophagus irregularis]|nr:unnamed protein product [Rhizophagus irregularis]
MGEPIIMGNIPELGEWKEFKVKLRQFKRSFQSYTTYWYSEPIKIPIERFQRAVKYNFNSNFIGKFELPRNFHPGSLLEVISKIQHDTFPSENLRVVSKGIGLLIHHDIDLFIDSISFNYDNYIEKFFENLDSIIPYINAISNENVYVKVVKWLISHCNLKMFSRIWALIIHSEGVDNQLRPHLVEKVERLIPKHDPVELNKCFKELPENIRNIVTEPFRKKLFNY